MELILYYSPKQAKHPIIKFSEFLIKKYSLKLDFIPSKFDKSSIGPLPVLQVGTFLFPLEQILPVLCHISKIDSSESKEYQTSAEMLKALCLEKFHNLTLLASSLLNTRALWQVPFTRFGFTSTGTLERRRKVFMEIDNFHQVLSDLLTENLFFYENLQKGRKVYSVDLIVFYCLEQELEILPEDSSYIKNSLKKHKNLLNFLENMKFLIKNLEISDENLIDFDNSFLSSRSLNLGKEKSRLALFPFSSSLKTSILLTTLFFYLALNG
jgi:hypothetical protein